MTTDTTASHESPSPQGWALRALRDLAIAALIVAALALIVSFLLMPMARAQSAREKVELRIGYDFNVRPVPNSVIADQQKLADTFFDLKLIPKAIAVRDAAYRPAP